jgi:hypothetical protein
VNKEPPDRVKPRKGRHSVAHGECRESKRRRMASEPRQWRHKNSTRSVVIMSPLTGLLNCGSAPFPPTAFAVGYVMPPAQAGFRACQKVSLTPMRARGYRDRGIVNGDVVEGRKLRVESGRKRVMEQFHISVCWRAPSLFMVRCTGPCPPTAAGTNPGAFALAAPVEMVAGVPRLRGGTSRAECSLHTELEAWRCGRADPEGSSASRHGAWVDRGAWCNIVPSSRQAWKRERGCPNLECGSLLPLYTAAALQLMSSCYRTKRQQAAALQRLQQ